MAAEAMGEAAATLHRASKFEDEEIRGCVRFGGTSDCTCPASVPRAISKAGRDIAAAISSADLTYGEADLAVCLYRPSADDLVVRSAGVMEFRLYGAPAYLRQHGTARNVTDLPGRCFIGYGEQLRHLGENRWLESMTGDVSYLLRSDHTHTRLAAAN